MIDYIELAYKILIEACGNRDNFSRYDHEVFKVVIDAHMEIERLTAAIAAERESCAKIADESSASISINAASAEWDAGWIRHGKEIAAAIRARGQT